MAKPTLAIRPIRPEDDKDVAAIIRTVMPEFGAVGEGYAINDPEVDYMTRAFSGPRSSYYVVTDGEKIVGGCGIAPLKGAESITAELQKMYMLPQARGQGIGRQLLARCEEDARKFGFLGIYIETLERMKAAQKLYAQNGYRLLSGPRGQTGHHSCDSWYLKEL